LTTSASTTARWSAGEVAQLYQLGAAKVNHSNTANVSINSGLVGYWTMDGQTISGTSPR